MKIQSVRERVGVLVISSLAAEKMNRLECMGGKSQTQAFAYTVDITTY